VAIPTIADHLVKYLTRPDVVERMEIAFEEPPRIFRDFVGMVGALIQRVEESPPSSGYEPWLIEHGVHRIFAQSLAGITVHIGNRIADDGARLPEVVRAIKFLASPGHHRRSISRRVAALLVAWKETSVIETIFLDAGLEEFEFARLLQSYADGDLAAYPRLMEIAVSLAPSLPDRRGPKISAASAAHEYFVENVVVKLDPRHAYTWNASEQKCTDSVTDATRREFGRPQFDSRSAYRRIKARRGKN
jgi:hypothetical protein